MTALDEQTVIVPGTQPPRRSCPASPTPTRRPAQRDESPPRSKDARCAPSCPVLTSMPGIGVRTAARILLEVGDGTAFATPATSPPTPARPGHPTLRQQHPRRTPTTRRQQEPQTAFFLAAFAALADPVSGPTTTANAPKANATTPPSSASPAAAATSSSPCSATKSPCSGGVAIDLVVRWSLSRVIAEHHTQSQQVMMPWPTPM